MTDINSNTSGAFDFFDFGAEDVEAVQDEIAAKVSTKNGQICICGHSMGRHSAVERGGVSYDTCTGNKGNQCQCKQRRAVVKVGNARLFLRKTIGSGPYHALAQGLLEAQKVSDEVEWLIEQKCDVCGKAGAISPCCVNDRDAVIEIDVKAFPPTKYTTKLLCKECRLGGE